jgi:hypothetical protein
LTWAREFVARFGRAAAWPLAAGVERRPGCQSDGRSGQLIAQGTLEELREQTGKSEAAENTDLVTNSALPGGIGLPGSPASRRK